MHELAPPERVRSDFDRIARPAADCSPHNESYQTAARESPDHLDSARPRLHRIADASPASRAGRVLGIDCRR
jgi:hypothetical protein